MNPTAEREQVGCTCGWALPEFCPDDAHAEPAFICGACAKPVHDDDPDAHFDDCPERPCCGDPRGGTESHPCASCAWEDRHPEQARSL